MVIIACGGRDFAGDAAKRDVCRALDRLNEAKGVDLVIHGAARGADSLASWWASSRQVQQEAFEVTSDDWNMYGKAAGHLRNTRMLDFLLDGSRGEVGIVATNKRMGKAIRRKTDNRKCPTGILGGSCKQELSKKDRCINHERIKG